MMHPPRLQFAVLTLAWLGSQSSLAAAAEPTAAARIFESTATLVDQPEIDAVNRAAIEELFAKVKRAIDKADGDLMACCFNGPWLMHEAFRAAPPPRSVLAQKEVMTRGVVLGLSQNLVSNDSAIAWERQQLKHAEIAKNGSALVWTRQWGADGASSKFCWRLVRQSGEWRIYDYEELEFGRRVSAQLAIGLALHDEPLKLNLYHTATQALERIGGAIDGGDFEAARNALNECKQMQLTPGLRPQRYFLEGLTAAGFAEHETALQHYQRARRALPTFTLTWLTEARSLIALERNEEALAALDEYARLLGWDADGLLEYGRALAQLGREDEALAALRRGLRDTPFGAVILCELAQRLPAEQYGELAEHYRRIDSPEYLVTAVQDLLNQAEFAPLRVIVAAHRERWPDDPTGAFYAAEILQQDEKYREAGALLQGAMERCGADQADLRDACRDSYLASMIAADATLEAYRTLGEPRAAFAELVETLWNDYPTDEEVNRWESLAALHRVRDPDDPRLTLVEAAILKYDEKTAEAAAKYEAVLQSDLEATWRDKAAEPYFEAMLELDRPLEAYLAARNRDQAFAALAQSLAWKDRFDALESLIAMHRLRRPNDPKLKYYTAALLESHGKDAEAAALWWEFWEQAGDDPLTRSALWRYGAAMTKAGRTLEAYEATCGLKDGFYDLASAIRWRNDAARLAELAAEHRRRRPDDVWGEYFGAVALLLSRDPAQQEPAKEQFGVLLQCEPAADADEEQRDLRSACFDVLLDQGLSLWAYDAAPDASEAFEYLAYELHDREDYAALEKLLERHRTRGGEQNADWQFYRGQAAAFREDWAEAKAAFTRGRALIADESPKAYRWELCWVRGKLGEAEQVYSEASDANRREVFGYLAEQAETADDWSTLQKICESHRAAAPEDGARFYWEALLLAHAGKYEAAWKLLDARREAILKAGDEEWRFYHLAVLCLAKMGRTEAALAEAKRRCPRKLAPFDLVMIHAHAGDVEQTLAALRRLSPGRTIPWLYENKDLRPIFFSPPFAALRAEFPPPPPEPRED